MKRRPLKRCQFLLSVFFVFSALSFVGSLFVGPVLGRQNAAGSEDRPRLVVLLVLDQFVPDYLVRFRDYFTGGFKTLLENGAVFLNAHYDHAITQTAAGHAVVVTGCQPAKTGIVANYWRDYATGKRWYAVEDPSVKIIGARGRGGRSPVTLKRSTVGDWLKVSDPQSKVVSISRKDRAAVLLGGKKADIALWFDTSTGRFVTSSYYTSKIPDWLKAFQAKRPTISFYRTWEKLFPEEVYSASREDFFPAEGDASQSVFPHRLRSPAEAGSYAAIIGTPFSDEQLLALARQAVEDVALGQDDHTDLLAIGLSATDEIGHNFGPFSQEMEDHVLRLDRALGEFFRVLDDRVGLENIVIAVSSDHGVMPMPEELVRRGFPAARRILKKERNASLDRISERLRGRLGVRGTLFRITNYDVGLLLEKSALRAAGLSADSVASLLAEEVRLLPFIETALTRADLREDSSQGTPFLELFRNNFYPARMADVFLVYKKYYLLSSSLTGWTSHGSPYDYDRRVPVIFFGKGVKSGFSEEQISVVDLAPTLAELVGISPPSDVDGRVLNEVLIDTTLKTGIGERGEVEERPMKVALFQNVPNPFNQRTEIRYVLPEARGVELGVWNLLGQKVAALVEGAQKAGDHVVRWDGKDGSGRGVSSGMYFYRMKAGAFVSTKRMVILK